MCQVIECEADVMTGDIHMLVLVFTLLYFDFQEFKVISQFILIPNFLSCIKLYLLCYVKDC